MNILRFTNLCLRKRNDEQITKSLCLTFNLFGGTKQVKKDASYSIRFIYLEQETAELQVW